MDRQFDAVIAEKLMGWQRWKRSQDTEAILIPAGVKDAEWGKPWEQCGAEVPLQANVAVPDYADQFGRIQDIAEAMGQRGFWLKLHSPFLPTDECKPPNPAYVAQWEKTRRHWVASFDFHGTTDSRPLWQASSENPAEAVVMATVACIEAHPEIF
jgi:hypothetical protein